MKQNGWFVKCLAASDFLAGVPMMLVVIFARGPRAYAEALRAAGDKVDRALTKHSLL